MRSILRQTARQLSIMATKVSFKPVKPDRIAIPQHMSVALSDQELQLCQLLDECTRELEREKGVKTSCRIAGGWVRDKVRVIYAYLSPILTMM